MKSDPANTDTPSILLLVYLLILLIWWEIRGGERRVDRQEEMKFNDAPDSRAAQATPTHGHHSTGSNPAAPALSDAGAVRHLSPASLPDRILGRRSPAGRGYEPLQRLSSVSMTCEQCSKIRRTLQWKASDVKVDVKKPNDPRTSGVDFQITPEL